MLFLMYQVSQVSIPDGSYINKLMLRISASNMCFIPPPPPPPLPY